MFNILWVWSPHKDSIPERAEWARENHDKLIAVLCAENEERMIAILNSFVKSWDVNKYLERQRKQKEFMYHRIRTVLNPKEDDNALQK